MVRKKTSKKKTSRKKTVKKSTRGNAKKKAIENSEERVPTGIKGFDKLIEGGFEYNSTNLIVGGSGSGKTIFATKFLEEGIRKGEPGLYITFEEKREIFFKNMDKLNFNLKEAEETGKFIFLEYSPEKVKRMMEEGGGSIEAIFTKNKIKRIVIDSITSFSLLYDTELEKRRAALALFDIIKKWSCTSLLTVQEDPCARKHGNVSSIEFESDSIILLYHNYHKGERNRLIEVLKMRGTDHKNKVYAVKIDKNGFNVLPTSKRVSCLEV